MSLKDRLNTAIPTPNETREKKELPKFYENNEVAKLGSLGVLDTLIVDDDLNSIYVNDAKNIFLERNGKLVKSTVTYRDNVQLENIIRRNAQDIGIEINEQTPYIKFNHHEGINVSATLPPLSVNANMYVKCYKDKFATIQALTENQSVSKEISLILEALSTIRYNIVILGERNTLKTTILSALTKLLPNNNRGIFVDYTEEVQIHSSNFSNFNFANIDKKETEILASIINSNPDRLSINNPTDSAIALVAKKALEGYKGIFLTIDAKSSEDAMEKITLAILKENPNIDYQTAKKFAYKAFQMTIFAKRDESGKRKIASISELQLDEFEKPQIKDIFFLNHILEHESTGYIPEFYEISKINSLPINSNIFEKTYKHTYYRSFQNDAMAQFTKKGANIEILKKFKKELPMEENAEVETQTKEATGEELIKKAQEKFEELKRNAKLEESINEEIEEIEETEAIEEFASDIDNKNEHENIQ